LGGGGAIGGREKRKAFRLLRSETATRGRVSRAEIRHQARQGVVHDRLRRSHSGGGEPGPKTNRLRRRAHPSGQRFFVDFAAVRHARSSGRVERGHRSDSGEGPRAVAKGARLIHPGDSTPLVRDNSTPTGAWRVRRGEPEDRSPGHGGPPGTLFCAKKGAHRFFPREVERALRGRFRPRRLGGASTNASELRRSLNGLNVLPAAPPVGRLGTRRGRPTTCAGAALAGRALAPLLAILARGKAPDSSSGPDGIEYRIDTSRDGRSAVRVIDYKDQVPFPPGKKRGRRLTRLSSPASTPPVLGRSGSTPSLTELRALFTRPPRKRPVSHAARRGQGQKVILFERTMIRRRPRGRAAALVLSRFVAGAGDVPPRPRWTHWLWRGDATWRDILSPGRQAMPVEEEQDGPRRGQRVDGTARRRRFLTH